MACLKCGKKTKEDEVFCPECLEIMENYPVKRDIYIQLPNRPSSPQKRSSRKRRNLTADEQVVYLRSRVRRLKVAVSLLVFLLLVALAALIYFTGAQEELLKLGTNYTYTE